MTRGLKIPASLIALALAAGCESRVDTVTAPAPSRCATAVEISAASFPAAGGSGTLRVTTARECVWSARSEAGWLALAAAGGQGDGEIPFTVSANDASATRNAAIVVNDLRREITQQGRPCEFQLSSRQENVSAAGGEIAISVTATAADCAWTASAGAPWLTIVDGGEGRGSGVVRVRAAPSTTPRSGTLTIAGASVQVDQGTMPPGPPPPGTPCALSLSPSVIQIGSEGGARVVSVQTADAACAWSALPDAPWIVVEGGQARTGNGTFTVRVPPTGGASRNGAIRVGDQTIGVFQGTGCAVSLAASAVQVPASGGDHAIAVNATSAECPWTAASNATWIAIAGNPSRAGSGPLGFSVAANTGPERSGTLTVAGHAVQVVQASGCSAVLSPASQSFPAQGGSASIAVQIGAGCPWTSAASEPWIGVTSGASGSGPGRVDISVSANSGPERSGSLTIAGRPFTVTQATGCAYTIAPAGHDAGGAAGGTSVTVSTTAGCPWASEPRAEWLSVSPASGSGPGTVSIGWTANMSPERTGAVRIAGQTFTVNQSSACAFLFVPSFHQFGANGGTGAVLVIVSGPCTWSAESTANWIRLTSGTSGTGGGVLQFAVDANTGPSRTGIITIAGRRYTVAQDGR